MTFTEFKTAIHACFFSKIILYCVPNVRTSYLRVVKEIIFSQVVFRSSFLCYKVIKCLNNIKINKQKLAISFSVMGPMLRISMFILIVVILPENKVNEKK